MCAISGLIRLEYNRQIQSRLLETMHRRGPDGQGVYETEECCLLHARLAIVDLAGGKQPMSLDWAGEKITLVYNGELYNTEEIRHQLIQKGHLFHTHSDTEVLLHAYAQWGEGCVEKLNGIFAFAVWEEKAKRLFLARDRIGVKPLFYKHHQEGFLFASEIKTILAYPTVKAELDEQGAAEIILLGPGRTPGCGVFRNIEELEPGCCGYYMNGKMMIRRYWKLLDREHRETFEETAECVRYLVRDAILRQMVSDVPLGTFLSGGLDSSLITAICAEDMARRGEPLKTFSVDYENNAAYFQSGKFQPTSDTEFIKLVQSILRTEHYWTVLTPDDLLSCLEDATIARDLPGMADVDFSLLAFCRQIVPHVKVALSGECADEIFGGYPWYRDPEVRNTNGFPWAQNGEHRMKLLNPNLWRSSRSYIMDRYEETCRESDILPSVSQQERRIKEMVNLNFRWFMQTLLDRKDRMSMYTGLEVRVPFCDYRIAEYLYGVPWEYKDHKGREKGLLRTAMEGMLPDEILWRKKSPYPKTFDPRYTELVSTRYQTLLQRKSAPIWQLLDRNEAEKLLTQEYTWPWYGQLMKGPQTLAYMLQINFWLENYGIDLIL